MTAPSLVYAQLASFSLSIQSRFAAVSSRAAADGSLTLRLTKYSAGRVGDLGRGGEVDDRVGALFRRDEERPEERDQKAGEAAAGFAEPGRDDAGMEAIGRHPGAGQAPGELAGEQDIGELRAAVDLEPVVALGALQVAEIEAHALVGGR